MRLSFLLCTLLLFAVAGCGSSSQVKELAGFDEYGLNEVAGQFHGSYFNNYCGRPDFGGLPPYLGDDAAYLAANGPVSGWHSYLQGIWQYRTTDLLMKWNHAWPDEGGWITNHMWDSYEDGGQTYDWDYFVKIVWVGPPPATGSDPYVATRIWGSFAIIQEVYNDEGTGEEGNIPIPGPNGFGAY